MKDYDKIKEKYDLPDFEELNKEFEISSIETEEFLLREIRRKMNEKICFFSDIIAGVVNTESSTTAMIEFGNLMDDDVKEAFNLYKKLMYWERSSSEAAILGQDEKDAAFIRELHSEWKELKKQVADLITKMKESWKKKTTEKEEAYFG